jgi:hypothetical protein
LSIHTDPGRFRVKLLALLGVVLTLLAALGLSLGSIARADTSGSPDTNTKAAFAPTAPNLNPGATLSGAAGGETVKIHVDGVAGKFFGVNAARLCKQGLTITTASQMSPSQFGNCIASPMPGAANDEFINAPSDSSHTFVDFVFRVGSGTQTFSTAGGPSTITCDVTSPCSIWLQEAVDTSIKAGGNVYKHYDVTYAGAPGAPGLSVTPGNGFLAVDLTAPANTGNSAQPLSYAVTVTGPGGATQTGTGTHYTFSGLTNSTPYQVSAAAKSTAADGTTTFTGPAATGSGTPIVVGTTMTAAPALVSVSPLQVYLLNLNGTLKDAKGAPLAGQRISFRAGSTAICDAVTGANGTATCSGVASVVQVALASGYTATFAGAGVYAPSSATASLFTT